MRTEIETDEQTKALPAFVLGCLAIIKHAPGGKATAREITKATIELFHRTRDAAQVHIALTRLQKRGLVEALEAKGRNVTSSPRYWVLTAAGMATAEETVRMMRIACDFFEAGAVQEKAPDRGGGRVQARAPKGSGRA